jgi:catechol 2,3-dioxygenase-like lactoylglutathione lyase family enzyme
MQIKFENVVFFVKDIEISKRFYTDVLGQEILMDFGKNVGFQHFAIREESLVLSMIFSDRAKKADQ